MQRGILRDEDICRMRRGGLVVGLSIDAVVTLGVYRFCLIFFKIGYLRSSYDCVQSKNRPYRWRGTSYPNDTFPTAAATAVESCAATALIVLVVLFSPAHTSEQGTCDSSSTVLNIKFSEAFIPGWVADLRWRVAAERSSPVDE